MPIIALILFLVSLLFQLSFSLYYSRFTYRLNSQFLTISKNIDNLELSNSQLTSDIARRQTISPPPTLDLTKKNEPASD